MEEVATVTKVAKIRHTITINKSANEGALFDVYWAECSCEWVGQFVDKRRFLAEIEGDEHLRAILTAMEYAS
jgi:hypothetical protein